MSDGGGVPENRTPVRDVVRKHRRDIVRLDGQVKALRRVVWTLAVLLAALAAVSAYAGLG